MTAIQHKKRSFAAGEVSDEFRDHDEYRVHQTGLAACEGFVVRPGGGLTRRPPTEFVTLAKPDSRLVAMDIKSNDSYLIEFWNTKSRFFRDGGLLLSSGVPYEVTHPYLAADLPLLRSQRSANALYLTHPVRGMWRLFRNGDVDWQSTAFSFKVRPFADENTDTSKKIQATARSGAVTLTATGFTFTSDMEGEQLKLREGDQRIIPGWRADATYNAGEFVSYNGIVYEQIAAGSNDSGASPPVHVEGVMPSARTGSKCLWRFVRRDFGIVQIDTVAPGGATATGTVIIALPEEFVDNFNTEYDGLAASHRWSEQAFSNRKGWPRYINIHQSRLRLYTAERYYYSVLASYDDFTVGAAPNLGGSELLGATSDRAADIQWALSGKVNVIGCTGEEFAEGAASSTSGGISAADLRLSPATSDGSSEVEAIKAKSAILHVGPDGRRLFEMSYNFQIDDFDSKERSLPSAHLLDGGVRRMGYQRDPLNVIWLADKSGLLLGLTYNPEQEVLAWHRHPMADCAVTDLAVVSEAETGAQDVWLRMRRSIDGRTVDSIERLLPYFNRSRDTDPLQQVFLDCQATAVGDGMTVVTGVPHLAGATVRVVSDKGDLGTRVVDADGAFDLGDDGYDRVIFGLSYRSRIRLLPLSPDMETGGTAGRARQVKQVKLRGIGVANCFIGNLDEHADLAEAVFAPQAAVDGLVLLQTPPAGLALNNGWDDEGVLDVWTDGPFAFDITGLDRVMVMGGQ